MLGAPNGPQTDGRRVARDRGASHVARLRVVVAAYAVHHLPLSHMTKFDTRHVCT
jgi:hypothetical protein